MASFFRTVREDVQIDEATASHATVYFEVNTHEAQTVTVSKGGAAFAASGGTTATQVVGSLYKLVIHADDVDTLGDVAFLSTGATDAHYIMGIRVVSHDPFTLPADVADAVHEEDITDHKSVADSFAEALFFIRQAAGMGVQECDAGGNTREVMDEDGSTPLVTITGATVGDVTTLTPS